VAALSGKTLFISGASRGIGKAIAIRAAQDGANIVIAAKSDQEHPRLPGTIFTAAAEVEKAGGDALPLKVDIRDETQVREAVDKTVDHFGSLDILVNNASAIYLAGTLDTPMKRFDLMIDVNVRGTFLCSQACLPYLLKAEHPKILNLAPPLDLNPKWFSGHVAYTIAKYGMSLCVLGMAEEFAGDGLSVSALWPRTVIATAAIQMLEERVRPEQCRRPEIVADAAHVVLSATHQSYNGKFLIDEEVLAGAGVADFSAYAVNPEIELATDLFVD
jgi:citronellol/citronellal dehydrogenase